MFLHRLRNTQKVFKLILLAFVITLMFGGGMICDFMTPVVCPILLYQPNICSTFRMNDGISNKETEMKSQIEIQKFKNENLDNDETANYENINLVDSVTVSAGGSFDGATLQNASTLQSEIWNKTNQLRTGNKNDIQDKASKVKVGDHISNEKWKARSNVLVYNKAEPNSELSAELEDAQFMLESPLAPGEDLKYNLGGPMFYRELDLVYCGITKTAHSQFRALLCLTMREPGDLDFVKDPFRAHFDKECKSKEIIISNANYESFKKVLQSQKIGYLATVRDPVDRFISAYIDKCIRQIHNCYNCSDMDVGCFAENTQKTMQNLSSGKQKYGTFKHSVNHFYPQYWSCDFQATLERYDYLFNYNDTEEFREEVRRKMLEFGIPNSIISVGWGENGTLPFMGVSTSHASDAGLADQVKNQIYSNLSLLNTIFETYYIDYRKFNFAVPWRAEKLCENEPEKLTITICRYVGRTQRNDE